MDNKLIYESTFRDDEVYRKIDNKYDNCWYTRIKRFFDIICSVLAIIILFPVIIIVFILIKLESKGPAIFKQVRSGRYGKPFYIYKFRSMKVNTPNIATNDFVNSDKYITKVGRIIRKTSIDEIPQLFNILKGEMSIVGPRPVILEEEDLISLRAEYNIDNIHPGITGWAQINGRDNIDNKEKVKYDYEYLINRSLKFDFYIIIKTALKVIQRSDIKD